ncbi:hypothetical protein IU433_12935 [Nocardia puris]|uniref:hypothetical protein n=1 Tax=Nocardia puris TaxID=208602 RepID=UPI001892EFE0|nr:hypothetical protein [Nocardia puris]MBF6213593.1 hypothetical protein [Nocardia puris]MBF6365477.1 hypothetical protein [Nocardia puris]MBF6459943.1 hypothetical protein [Nocardia puris]
MTDSLQVEDLNRSIGDFEKAQKEWEELPDKLNDEMDSLRLKSPVLYLKATSKRDDIQETFKEIINKFKEISQGIAAPYLFVRYAADWQAVAATVRGAHATLEDPNVSMEGHWSGLAKERYSTSVAAQMKAMSTTVELCNNVHDELISLARAGHLLYTEIVKAIAGFYASITEVIVDVSTVFGVLEALGAIGSLAANTINSMTSIFTTYVGNLQEQGISANKLKNLRNNPFGMPNNRWPQALGKDFNDPKLWELATS